MRPDTKRTRRQRRTPFDLTGVKRRRRPRLQTRPLYGRKDDRRPDRVWHIFPPDRTDRRIVNDASWCGRYMIQHDQLSTVKPVWYRICQVCLAQQRKRKLRQPSI